MMNRQTLDVRKAIAPLRMVFWGGVLLVIDFTISTESNGAGFRFDVANDLVGMILITVGVVRLSRMPVSVSYGNCLACAFFASLAGCLQAANDHFIYEMPVVLAVLGSLVGLFQLVAFCLFVVAMEWLSLAAGLPRAARSWKTTFVLVLVIYACPLGVLHATAIPALLSGEHWGWNWEPGGEFGGACVVILLVVAVMLVPLIHFFVSTSRMIDEARSRGPKGDRDLPGGGAAGDESELP